MSWNCFDDVVKSSSNIHFHNGYLIYLYSLLATKSSFLSLARLHQNTTCKFIVYFLSSFACSSIFLRYQFHSVCMYLAQIKYSYMLIYFHREDMKRFMIVVYRRGSKYHCNEMLGYNLPQHKENEVCVNSFLCDLIYGCA